MIQNTEFEKGLLFVASKYVSIKRLIFFAICIMFLVFAYFSASHQIQVVGISVPPTLGTNYFLHNDTANVSFLSKNMNKTIYATEPIAYFNYTALQNGNTFLQNWTSSELNFNLIPAGVQGVHLHTLKIGGPNKVIRLFYNFGIVNSTGGNYTFIKTSDLGPEVLTTIPYIEADIHMLLPDLNVNKTDRIVISLYAT